MSFLTRVKQAASAIGRIFAPTPARAALHSGRNSSEMTRLWPFASNLHPDLAINQEERQNAVNRSQEEFCNNPVYQGHIRTLTKIAIGRGPILQVIAKNRVFSKTMETEWVRWAKRVGLSEKLRLMNFAFEHSGEAFGVFINRPGAPVTLDIRLIEGSRVTDGRSKDGGGIVFDEFGEPAFYNILKTHPGISGASKEFTRVPASAVIHYRTLERPEQTRGVPTAASALINYQGLHRYTAATIRTAENQACFTGVLESDYIPQEGDEAPEKTPIPVSPGSFLTMPDGLKAKAFDATQPTSTHKDFVNTVNSQNAMPLGLPAFLAQMNAAPYSYAGVRGDQVTLEKIIETKHDDIEKQILRRIVAAWFEEARLVYGWTLEEFDIDTDIQWNWRGQEHIDPVKEATASRMLIQMNLSTLAIECAKRGLDWEDVQDQRAKEIARAKSLGITEESTSFSETPIQPDNEIEEENADNK